LTRRGSKPEARDLEERFFEAGCDDATISFQKGVTVLEFAREAHRITVESCMLGCLVKGFGHAPPR